MNFHMRLRVSMEDMLANSLKDYHVKGFDYLCLHRSEKVTLKAYFFDADVSKLPEVVNPHDHRYDFLTYVGCGAVQNVRYEERADGDIHLDRFAYRTPLNGGDGFTWDGETRLKEIERKTFEGFDSSYFMRAEELHTIRIVRDQTILLLAQYEDRVPVGVPTKTFADGREPPSLSGLYSTFTPDDVRRRLDLLKQKTAVSFVMVD